MALREFIDSQGRAWKAWDVPPHRVFTTVRAASDRRVRVTPGYAPERRLRAERRHRVASPHLEHGWVCFESGPEKRRLAPPPSDWADAAEGDLEELCERAAQGSART
jgi:hypothetical protein